MIPFRENGHERENSALFSFLLTKTRYNDIVMEITIQLRFAQR